MMQIYLVHPRHGKKIAYMDKEADADKKAGWKEVTEVEFYGRTETADVQKPKIGRPRKVLNDSTEA